MEVASPVPSSQNVPLANHDGGQERFEESCSSLIHEAPQEAFEPQECTQETSDKPPFSPTPRDSNADHAPWTSDVFGFSFSFYGWCSGLTRRVLACRTSFSRFLASTLFLRRDGPKSPPTALFPLPLPCFWPNAPVIPGSSKKRRLSAAVDRALHVIVSALNFAYCSRGWPVLDQIRRQPNETQLRALKHLRSLLSACDPSGPIEVASSGRKNLQLMARLQELTHAADSLGFRESPYHQHAAGSHVKVDNSWDPKLSPFSPVDPSRLKISGTGNWRAEDHLSPEFFMPFVEPRILECDVPVFDRGVPDLNRENPEAILSLLLKWDSLDLLKLHPASHIGASPDRKVRIFGAYKDSAFDRQIGDRRLQNAYESRIPGPSRQLPTGSLLTRLVVPPGFGLKTCITDRADFYHQIAVSNERSQTNCVWPSFPLSSFRGTKAHDELLKRSQERPKKLDRAVFGDELHGVPSSFPKKLCDDTPVFGGFSAVLQGDQLGVEFGIDSHAGLLRSHGLLDSSSRLQSTSLVRPGSTHQGLVIDDFFVTALVPEDELRTPEEGRSAPSQAAEIFHRAKAAYASEGLRGSDAKDVFDQPRATVIGAELDSRFENVKAGLLPVGSPSCKRLALSWMCLEGAQFAYTTDALLSSLVGSLVSSFCFRRCAMSLLDKVFALIPPSELDTSRPKLHALPRSVADELVLSGVLLPILVTNIKAEVLSTVFASDASNERGAFCEAPLPEQVATALWQSGDFKGGYSRLEPFPLQFLRSYEGLGDEELEEMLDDGGWTLPQPGAPHVAQPSRQLAQYFDFIEICGGSGVLSDEMNRRGFVVGPIIDISFSSQFDLLKTSVLGWLIFLLQNNRLRSFAVEPPCTSFSAAAHPCVRSYRQPRGFCQQNRKTWVGNRLAFAALCLLLVAAHTNVFGLGEQPRRGKMAWLSEWQYLLTLDCVRETFTASCSFGSRFQKEFRFITANMVPDGICRPCTRDHGHVRIEGSLTKGSAVYCPGLVTALGLLFEKHLNHGAAVAARKEIRTEGLESAFANDIAKNACWSVGASWKWSGFSHINILELASILQVLKKVARRCGGRFALLVDSFVALRAVAKGRSASKALSPLLRKIMAISIAFDCYASGIFCPTRLNPSDDPTRSVPLREPISQSPLSETLGISELYRFAELPKVKKWAANWISLTIGLFAHGHFSVPAISAFDDWRVRSKQLPIGFHEFTMDFDSTLGFPGEGPFGLSGFPFILPWTFCFVSCWQFLTVHSAPPVVAAMVPRNADDVRRASRRGAVTLDLGRPVQPSTKSNREKLIAQFQQWCHGNGISLDELFETALRSPERLVKVLTDYGQELFSSGRPYSHSWVEDSLNQATSVRSLGLRFCLAPGGTL